MDSEKTESCREPRGNSGRQPRDQLLLNIGQPLLLRSLGRYLNSSTSSEEYETLTALLASDFAADVELGKFDVVDAASTGSTPFCRVVLNDDNKTLQCQQIKNIASFICTCKKNFSHCRRWQTGATSVQPRQQHQYQQGWNHRGRWSKYGWRPSSNRNPTLSINSSECASRGGTNYARRLRSRSNNRNYKNSGCTASEGLISLPKPHSKN